MNAEQMMEDFKKEALDHLGRMRDVMRETEKHEFMQSVMIIPAKKMEGGKIGHLVMLPGIEMQEVPGAIQHLVEKFGGARIFFLVEAWIKKVRKEEFTGQDFKDIEAEKVEVICVHGSDRLLGDICACQHMDRDEKGVPTFKSEPEILTSGRTSLSQGLWGSETLN